MKWVGQFTYALEVLLYSSGLKHSVKALIILRQCLQKYGLLFILALSSKMINSNFGDYFLNAFLICKERIIWQSSLCERFRKTFSIHLKIFRCCDLGRYIGNSCCCIANSFTEDTEFLRQSHPHGKAKLHEEPLSFVSGSLGSRHHLVTSL